MTSVTPESLYYLQDRNIFLSLGLLGGGGDYDFLRTVGFGLFRVLSSSMLVFAHACTQCPFTFSHTVVVLSFLRQFSPFVCFLVNAFPFFLPLVFPACSQVLLGCFSVCCTLPQCFWCVFLQLSYLKLMSLFFLGVPFNFHNLSIIFHSSWSSINFYSWQ